MRTLFGFFALVLSTSLFAQNLKFPVNCDVGYRTPSVEALCVHHRAATIEAEEKYVTALVRLKSMDAWRKLQDIRIRFVNHYNACAVRGNADAVAECLAPAFDSFVKELPQYPPGQLYGNQNTHMDAASLWLIRTSNAALDSCFMARIKVLDDGVSPARDIAQSIGTEACKAQALNWATVIVEKGTSFLSRVPPPGEVYKAIAVANNVDEKVKLVLEYRAQQRSKSQPVNKSNAPRKVES